MWKICCKACSGSKLTNGSTILDQFYFISIGKDSDLYWFLISVFPIPVLCDVCKSPVTDQFFFSKDIRVIGV